MVLVAGCMHTAQLVRLFLLNDCAVYCIKSGVRVAVVSLSRHVIDLLSSRVLTVVLTCMGGMHAWLTCGLSFVRTARVRLQQMQGV